ncbi:hypothetical protein ABPG74_004964 [Tetrahymena malaccensis]
MTSSELQLRNSQIYESSLNLSVIHKDDKINLNEEGELMSEEDLTKNKVKKAIIETMLQNSKKLVNTQANDEIKQQMGLIEQRVYWRATQDSNIYFHNLFQQLKQNHPNMPEVSQKINDLNSKIVTKIKEGGIKIQKKNQILNKAELYVLESSFYKRRLSNQKLSLEHKIENLDNHIDYLKSLRQPNGQLDKSLTTRALYRSVHEFNPEEFALQSEKTQTAKQFLKKIKKEQELTKTQLEEMKKKEEEKKKKQEEKQEQEKLDEKRKKHEELVNSLQQQKESQKMRQEFITKNQEEFKQFYKNYKTKKPLYEIMEESYKQKAEIEVQQEKLTKLRELYRPHRLEDFEEHYRRYKEFKQSEVDRLSLKKSAYKSTMSLHSNSSMWRGRIHEILEEEMKNQLRQSASEDKKIRMDRQKQYASMVKQNHVPKKDSEKNEEIVKRITNLNQPKNLIQLQIQKQEIQTEPNAYRIGKDYFEFAKKYNRDHKKQEDEKAKEQKIQQQSDDTNVKVSQQKALYKNYMKEERVKQVLKKDDPNKNWDQQVQRLQGTEKVEKVLMAAQMLDVQARRKEQILKYNKTNDSSLAEDLDDCYFSSIKAKIALLKDYHQMTK